MGRVKDMQADYESGLMHTFDEDRKVCAEHFSDPYLQDYIRKNGYKGKCSYCGKKKYFSIGYERFYAIY